jgi:hypothetical protein
MNVREPGIRERVGWILPDRLLKVIDRLLQVFSSAFIPEVAPLQVELVCFRVFRRPRCQHMFRRACQLGLQPFGHGLRNLAFHRKNIGQFAIVGFGPQMRVGRGMN